MSDGSILLLLTVLTWEEAIQKLMFMIEETRRGGEIDFDIDGCRFDLKEEAIRNGRKAIASANLL